MTKADTHYSELVKRIQELENHFLADYFKKSAIDPSIAYDENNVYAYSLMSHAAIEHYFEKVVRFVLEECLEKWLKQQRILKPTLCLAMHYISERRTDTQMCDDYFTQHIKQIKLDHESAVDANNGIKLINLSNMLNPIGVDTLQRNMILQGSLNTFGSYRGEIAHSAFAKSTIPPETIKKWVQDCLDLGNELRNEVNSLVI
jgi:hypothetical protein